MNARQAAREAAKKIELLETINRIASADIKAYNIVIEQLIAGKSPCPMCEELSECQRPEKDGKGCSEWWLMNDLVLPETEEAKNRPSAGEKSIVQGLSPEGEVIDG